MGQPATHFQFAIEPRVQMIFDPVRQELTEVERELFRWFNSNPHVMVPTSRYLQDRVGRRLRPSLLLLTAKLFGCPTTSSLIRMAAVIEGFYAATLVHVEVTDSRHDHLTHPPVNRLSGDDLTVLSGDWLFVRAIETALKERNFEVLKLLSTLTRMIEGQLAQLAQIGNIKLSTDEYLEIARRKTGVLFSVNTQLGGLLAGASTTERHALAEFGLNLGMAFQLTDDADDLTADGRTDDPPFSRDLQAGTVTLPIIYLVQQGNPIYLQLIQSIVQEKDYGQVNQAELIRSLEESGALDQARALARQFSARARAYLDSLPHSQCKVALLGITEFVTDRSIVPL